MNAEKWILSLAACVAVLLGLLAALQWRWVEGAAEAEKGRLRVALDGGARGVADGLDRDLAQIFSSLVGPLNDGEQLSDRLAPYRSSSESALISEVFSPDLRATSQGNPRWGQEVQFASGSLALRRSNLLVGAAILILLAATVGGSLIVARRARRLARRQLELIAGITHELHTPLTAIRSAGQNLADGIITGDQVARYGEMIEVEGRRLSDLVAKALQLAGLESKQVEFESEVVDLGKLAAEALDAARLAIDENGVRVEVSLEERVRVLGDFDGLRRCVSNLIDNAVKYGEGGMRLEVRTRGDRALVVVADVGGGIDRVDRGHVFEPFYRGRRHLTGTVHGSGLGLSLVRRLVQAHDGRIDFTTGDSGTTFTISLPRINWEGL